MSEHKGGTPSREKRTEQKWDDAAIEQILRSDYINKVGGQKGILNLVADGTMELSELWEELDKSPFVDFDDYVANFPYARVTLDIQTDEVLELIKQINILAKEANNARQARDFATLKDKVNALQALIVAIPLGPLPKALGGKA